MATKDIEGYDEFQRATSKIVDDLPKDMRTSANDMAAEWVSAAKANTTTNQQALAAAELFVNSEGDGAMIGNPSPLFFGSEFGGQGRPETMQFPPFNGSRGYWFYPARRQNEDRLLEVFAKGIDQAFEPWDRR